MRKVVSFVFATIFAMLATAAAVPGFAADMPVKAAKAPIAVPSPWDLAFGAAAMNDYVFRGITQSDHKPSVAVYFEPRYNINNNMQLYAGLAGESIDFPNRAAAEIDFYGGIRPTFGALAFDFGGWYYYYPGGKCFNANANLGTFGADCIANADPITLGLPINGNVVKKDVSFFEVYGKGTWNAIPDTLAIGANFYYSPSFLNTDADGEYLSGTFKWTAPASTLGGGLGMYVSGELGYQWLGTTDNFYGIAGTGTGIDYADYATWNIGVGFTYKVLTLDLRYSDTNLSKGDCNAFTSDHAASGAGTSITAINPGGFSSNWCGAAFIAKLSADLTLGSLK